MPPATGNACATYIGIDRILTHIEDPPTGEGKRFEVNKEKFYDAYYAPFLLAEAGLQTSPRKERIDGMDVDFFDLEKGGRKIRIGLDSEIAELVLTKKYDFSESMRQRIRGYSSLDSPVEKYSIGLDGFFFSYIE